MRCATTRGRQLQKAAARCVLNLDASWTEDWGRFPDAEIGRCIFCFALWLRKYWEIEQTRKQAIRYPLAPEYNNCKNSNLLDHEAHPNTTMRSVHARA